MADTNTTTQQATDALSKVYPTKAECEADETGDAPQSLRVYKVTKGGAAVGWIWARGYDAGLAAMARKDGYTVSTGKTKEVSKEAVAAKLATFTDDARHFGAQRDARPLQVSNSNTCNIDRYMR